MILESMLSTVFLPTSAQGAYNFNVSPNAWAPGYFTFFTGGVPSKSTKNMEIPASGCLLEEIRIRLLQILGFFTGYIFQLKQMNLLPKFCLRYLVFIVIYLSLGEIWVYHMGRSPCEFQNVVADFFTLTVILQETVEHRRFSKSEWVSNFHWIPLATELIKLDR